MGPGHSPVGVPVVSIVSMHSKMSIHLYKSGHRLNYLILRVLRQGSRLFCLAYAIPLGFPSTDFKFELNLMLCLLGQT